MFAAADDDEIGVALFSEVKQTLGWIAELDDWRSSSHAGEVSLELDGDVRILRAET